MISKIAFASLAATGGLMLSAAPSCDTKAPGQDQNTGCVVHERAENSKGKWYVGYECNRDDASGLDRGAELIPGNDPRGWPGCTMGAEWPACKNG